MQSLQVDQLTKRLAELNKFCDYVRQSIMFFRRRSTPDQKDGGGAIVMADPSPECQGPYNTWQAAEADYSAAVTATNNAMANEQTKDLLRQAAWEEYLNCESP